jgi:hypothetical protein
MRRRKFITLLGGSLHGAAGDVKAFASQLPPDLAHTIDPEVLLALLRVIIFGLGLLLLLNAGLVRRVNQNTLDRATTIANERPQARLP